MAPHLQHITRYCSLSGTVQTSSWAHG